MKMNKTSKLKRFLCTFLALTMVLTSIPQVGLMMRVLANMNADKISVNGTPENKINNDEPDLLEEKSSEETKENDIKIDLDYLQFSFNDKTKNYDSKGVIKSITGTLSTDSEIENPLEEVKSFKYTITSLDGVFEGDIDISEKWEVKAPPLSRGINGIRFELISDDDTISAKAMTVNYQHKIEKRGLKSADTQPKYDPAVYAAFTAPKPAATETPEYIALCFMKTSFMMRLLKAMLCLMRV